MKIKVFLLLLLAAVFSASGQLFDNNIHKANAKLLSGDLEYADKIASKLMIQYANDSAGLSFFFAGIIKAKSLYSVYRFKESSGLVLTLEKKIASNPDIKLQQQAYALLAEHYISINDLVKAEQLLKINATFLAQAPTLIPVADYQLVWAKLYQKQGYNKQASTILEKQVELRKSMADSTKFLKTNTYFKATTANKFWHKQKYAEVLFAQAEAEYGYGNTVEADRLLHIVIETVATLLGKDHLLYVQANLTMAALYADIKQPQKSIASCFTAYTAHKAHDYEPVKINLLATIIRKYYEVGNDVDGKNYLRRLQMFAIRNVGKKEPVQLAYECSEAIRLYTENNFKAAIDKLEYTLKTFSFLPESHSDRLYINALMAEIYENQGNTPKFLTTTDLRIQVRKKYAGNTPNFHALKLHKATYLSRYGTDPKATKSTWDSSYYKVCATQWYIHSPQALKVLSAQAVYFYRNGDLDSALSVQTRVVNLANKVLGEYSPYSMKESVQLAEIQILKAKYKEALSTLELLETAAANATKGAKAALVESNVKIAKLNGLLGNLIKSKFYVNEAQKVYEGMTRSYFFTTLDYDYERSNVNYEAGNYFRAERTLAKLHTTAENLGNKGQYLLFPTYLAEAKVSMVNGSFPKAEKLISTAAACIKEGNLDFAKLQISFAEYFVAISDYKTALEKINLADNLVSNLLGAKHLYRAETMSVKGYILSKMPNPNLKEVEALYLSAGTIISNAVGIKNPLYINNLQKLAGFYMQVGLLDDAEKLLFEAQKYWIATTGENNTHVADIKMLLGKIDYERSKYPNAYTHFDKAATIYKTIFNSKHPDYIKAQSQIARVYFMRKDASKSLEIMEDIIPNYLEYTKKYFPTLSFRQKSKYWATLKDDFEFYTFLAIEKNADAKPKLRSDIYNLVISTKALLLSTDIKMRKQILNSKDTTLINIFNEWLAQKSLLTTALSLSKQEQQEQGISEEDISNSLEKLEKEMSTKSEIFNSTEKNSKIVWQDIRNALLTNETAVEMVRYRTFNKVPTDTIRYVALILQSTSRQYPEYVKMNDGTDMERKYLKYYRNSTINRTEDEISYANFWEPIKAKIPDGQVVYFSSEGVYNQINVETLRKSDNTFVIDKNDIVLVTNTKDLLIYDKSTKEKNPNAVVDFVVCGNPKFYSDSTETKRSVKGLPGAEEEAKLVENVMSEAGKVTIKLLSQNVTEDTLRNIKNPTIFHIATHGYFKETVANANEENFADNPLLNSGLMLSGSGDIVDNQTNHYINQKDGILTAYEAIDLNFDKTQLVVLSACETGRGQVEVGEGVFGLQRSFLVAGAHSIILSLFKVDDDATNMLMVSMYKKALFNGGDYRKAFKEAKNEVRSTSKFKDSIYWGAFIMVEGKPGRNVLN